MYKKLIEEIKNHKTIIIHRHEKPDGDAYGSQHGLAQFIRLNFKGKKVITTGSDESNHLKHLFPKMVAVSDKDYKNSLVIIVDTANKERISGKFDFKLASKIIKIDHHPAIDEFGKINFTQPKAASACEIVADIIFSNKSFKIDEETARYVYTGMITDTNRFMFESVTSKSLELASKVYEHVDKNKLKKVYQSLYARPIEQVRFNGYIMQHSTLEGKVSYLKLPKGKHNKFGVTYETASSSVNILLQSKETTYAAYGTWDQGNKCWRVSLRSKNKAVNKICQDFGGGGHKQACGIKLKSASDFTKIVEQLKKL